MDTQETGTKPASGWRGYFTVPFLFTQLEIIFCIFIAILPVLVFSLQVKGRSAGIPDSIFSMSTVAGAAGRYYGGIIASAIFALLLTALTLKASFSGYRLTFIKSSIVSIIMTFITVNFIIAGGIVTPAAVDGVLFFSFFCGFLLPLAIMVRLESKRTSASMRSLALFCLLLLIAALPQIVRMQNPATSLYRYFMDLAIVYVLAFAVIVPYELTRDESSMFWRFVKFTYLYIGAGIIAAAQQGAYMAASLVVKGLLGLRTAADAAGDLAWLGNMQIAAAPYHIMWSFIRDYILVRSPQDLFEALFFFWAVASLVTAGKPVQTTFRSRWLEIICGGSVVIYMTSRVFM